MSKGNWKRARSDEQIEQRVQEILDAAGKVFQETPYDKVTMLMIAKEAGSSRSNLYRYFKTREEIFLTLFLLDLDTWAKQAMSAFTKEVSLENFAAKWTEILCRQNRLLELSPLLSLSLEKNTSEEVLRKTKLALHDKMAEVIPVIQKALPSFTAEQVYDFFITHQALTAGAWPMGQNTEIQRKVLDELDLPHGHFDFTAFYEKTILTYLRGIIKKQKKD